MWGNRRRAEELVAPFWRDYLQDVEGKHCCEVWHNLSWCLSLRVYTAGENITNVTLTSIQLASPQRYALCFFLSNVIRHSWIGQWSDFKSLPAPVQCPPADSKAYGFSFPARSSGQTVGNLLMSYVVPRATRTSSSDWWRPFVSLPLILSFQMNW